MHTFPAIRSAPIAVNELYGPAQDEYVWQEEKKKSSKLHFFSPFNTQERFTRSSPSKISLYTSHKALFCWSAQGLRNKKASKSEHRQAKIRTIYTQAHISWTEESFWCIGSRYVQVTRFHRNLLTLSLVTKDGGLWKLVELTLNALTFMVLSPLLPCHLQSAHSVIFSLMQFSTFPIHPSLCEAWQKKIMA